MPTEGDVWERYGYRWHVAFLAMLVFAIVFALVDDEPHKAGIAVGTLAVAGWYWLSRPHGRSSRRAHVGIHLAGSALGSLALSLLHPSYLAPLGALVGHTFLLLELRWAIVASTLLAVAMAVRLLPFMGTAALVGVALALFVSIALAAFIESIVRQSRRRRELIEELEATRQKLAETEREAGATSERRRLAREIHDTVTQDLISALRLIESAARTLGAEAPDARRYLALAEGAAREGLAESRRLVWATRPAELEGANLREALERTCTRFAGEAGVEARLSFPSEPGALPTEVEVALLRAAQEALANVRKHSRARSVVVTVTRMSDRVALDVRDDGDGFDPLAAAGTPAPGFGLRGLRQRMEQIGGELAIETAPGEGTTVAVQIPLPALAEPSATGAGG